MSRRMGFHTRIEIYLIERYIKSILNESTPLSKKIAQAYILPAIVRSILIRTPLPPFIFDKIRYDIEYYNQLGFNIENITSDSLEDILIWYNRNTKKRENESDTTWVKRVAVVSNIILSDILIQKIPREVEILGGEHE